MQLVDVAFLEDEDIVFVLLKLDHMVFGASIGNFLKQVQFILQEDRLYLARIYAGFYKGALHVDVAAVGQFPHQSIVIADEVYTAACAAYIHCDGFCGKVYFSRYFVAAHIGDGAYLFIFRKLNDYIVEAV